MKRRILVLLAAILLLVSSLFVSCGSGDGDETTSPDNSSDTTPASDESTAPVSTVYDPLTVVPIEDFGEYTFKILTPTRTWAICNMTCEDVTADTIQDAIYTRQVKIENRLNISLYELQVTEDIATRLQKTQNASGDDFFDIALVATYNALNLYKKGLVLDFGEIDSIDLENPWWESDFNANVNLGDNRYIAFGNANLIYYSAFYIFCFNQSMITDNNLENPYDLVSSQDWTWDKVYEMMEVAVVDANNDGLYRPADGDTLGITGHINHSRNLILSSGQTITKTGTDGYPVYDGLSENYISAFTKYTDYFIISPYAAIAGYAGNPYSGYVTNGYANYVQVFDEGRSLFLTTGTNEVINLRQSATTYGIVVVPKYNKTQADYVTPVYSATEGFVIPTITDKDAMERTGLILETLGALSYNNLVEKHIKIVLHSKVAKDEVAVDMINLAYAKGSVDTAMANNFGSCTNMLNNLNTQGSKDITSIFGMIGNKLKQDIIDATTGLE